jgi:hypothetical protein
MALTVALSARATCGKFRRGKDMDTRDGTIYDTIDAARAAGVPDEFLVSGTREALENLRPRIVFSKGSFKVKEPARVEDEHR